MSMVARAGVADEERVEWPALGQKEDFEVIEERIGCSVQTQGQAQRNDLGYGEWRKSKESKVNKMAI